MNIHRVILWALTPTSLLWADIEHGSLTVTEPVSTANLSLGPGTTSGISLPSGSNAGDYWLDFSPPEVDGILLSSVSELSRDGNYATASAYELTSPAHHFISIHQSATGSPEDDINVAFAFFPINDFLAGFAGNNTNNGPLTSLLVASPQISFSTALGQNAGAEFVYDGATAGVSTLDLTAILSNGLSSSSQNGILLVNGAKNEGNYALSRANTDGTFSIFSHDNFTNGANYESDPVSFVYLPLNHGIPQIIAMGRVQGDGAPLLSDGTFSLTNPSDSVWHLSIPNQDDSTGTLIISPEGGATGNNDNILSYERDPTNQHWIIQSRDLPGLSLLADVSSEPVFSFAFFGQVKTVYVDADATAGNNDGSSWANAFTKLQDALAGAPAGSEIWVAEGTYYPDEGSGQTDGDRSATFQLLPNTKLYGGFQGTETSNVERKPGIYRTILSGDLDQDDSSGGDMSENAYHVTTYSSAGTTLIDGFTISAGNANGTGGNANGGGLYFPNSNPTLPQIINCIFEGNLAALDGGGVYIQAGSLYTFTNCSFQGNHAGSNGGGVALAPFVLQDPLFINCTFQGNSAQDGGAFSENSSSTFSHAQFTNCVIWNNAANGATDTSSASIFGSRARFSYSLVENLYPESYDEFGQSFEGEEGNNLDGTNPANDPLFTSPTDPVSAPVTGGNLRPLAGSLLINAGDSSANTSSTDLANNPRITPLSPIDLGAYEFQQLIIQPESLLYFTPSQGIEDAIPSWVPDAANFTLSSGLTYTFTSQTGPLLFDSLPIVDPDGTLRLTRTAGSPGYASFLLTVSDSLGIFTSSEPFLVKVVATLFVDAGAAGDNDGAGWSDAFNHLQDALTVAGELDGVEIWIAEGTYYPDEGNDQTDNDRNSSFELTNDVAIYGGFNGTELLRSERNPSSYQSILSGDLNQDDTSGGDNSENAYNVILSRSVAAEPILDGLTITAGNADGDDLDNTGRGGGFFNGNGALPSFNGCVFQGNYGIRGGGVFNDTGATLSFTDCVFISNNASFRGGGICDESTSISTITNCLFENNRSPRGGGVYSAGSPSFINCLFQSNSAGNGGAIYHLNNDPVFINCSFQKNVASSGGGIYIILARAHLINCSFRDNHASIARSNAGGGGIFVFFVSTFVSMTNCILWGNTEGGLSNTLGASMSTTLGTSSFVRNSLVENWSKAALDNVGFSSSNNLEPVDPLFASSNGGHLRLLIGSPALDAGDNTANATLTDLAGNPRLAGNGTIDLGAFEGGLSAVTFSILFPNLTTTGDENNNGLINYLDYALGADPTSPQDSSFGLSFTGGQVTYTFRNNTADAMIELEKSTTLLPDSWSPMILNTDYTLSNESINGSTSIRTINLLTTDPDLFIRGQFTGAGL